ncbi:hypothetical protein K1T71_002789 [Dendrolimus kikuchii]|uniref:Uncharacterized protein n=1 Tax=Dendrolimus kikuchii TaxID=765133 RepID=A0ACC1DEP1_9NEOP|nr:hypothetical protein K1T71_002789 [Dendrolimus kikuchii]
MEDVDDIIDYIKTLKRGFDKDLYQNKIDQLSYVAETVGLGNDDLHTLFKIWLNLSIPIAKWTSLGGCLIPQDIIEERTVDYALCWILATKDNLINFPKIAYVLDWLTAAMDCNCIDMETLESGYDIFFAMLTYELLSNHVIKLVYTLTKPTDVTRKKVLEILDYIKLRESKRNWLRQLQVVLGLFKSYKPELVPEDVPAMSIHTAFKKTNADFLRRFQNCQDRRNSMKGQKHHLLWMNPLNSKGSKSKNAAPLVPNVEFHNIGSKQYAARTSEKTYLDFADATSLVQYSLYHNMSRPAKLRALLCNETGVTLLAVASPTEYSFFSHDLYQLLNICFLEVSPYSYVEKQDLLQRLVILQQTLMQGVPVITRFLAQYLPLWNERNFFGEILDLIEWISVDNPNQVPYITEPLMQIYHRAKPIEQCAILRSLTNTYCNLVFTSTRTQPDFIGMNIPQENYTTVLQRLAKDISMMCDKGLQVNPDDFRILYTSVGSVECRSLAELRCAAPLAALPGKLTLALPMTTNSAHLLDKIAGLMILYKRIFRKSNNTVDVKQVEILERISVDILNCLYKEQAITERKQGMIFNSIHPQLIAKLSQVIPDVDSKFSIRNSLAFMPYVRSSLESDKLTMFDNKYLYYSVIKNIFQNLDVFLKTVVPELRS